MKIVKSIRKANKTQIKKLSSANVAVILQASKIAPVTVKIAQVGTSVRPEVATIVNGAETVESFLARGGAIKIAPASLRGLNAKSNNMVRVSGTGSNRFANRYDVKRSVEVSK